MVCSIRGDCAVVDGLRNPHEPRPTSVFPAVPSPGCGKVVMGQGVGAVLTVRWWDLGGGSSAGANIRVCIRQCGGSPSPATALQSMQGGGHLQRVFPPIPA